MRRPFRRSLAGFSSWARWVAPQVGALFLAATSFAVPTVPADGLQVVVTVTDRISISVDGSGTVLPTSTIQVEKPNAQATVREAYLMCAAAGFTGRTIADGDVSLDGNPVTWSQVVNNGFFSSNTLGNVTAVVKPKVDAAAPGLISFTQAEVGTGTIDGCGLYVVFDDPTKQPSTAFLLFGGQSTTGDDFAVDLANPLSAGQTVQLGLAISYSFQGGGVASNLCETGVAQSSLIDVNGTRITSCAGHADDAEGGLANGNLITVGGIGDSAANPTDPLQQPADGALPRIVEDELYDLTSFLPPPATQILVHTLNPSNDDNIFAGHIVSPPGVIGEGCTLSPISATNPVGTSHTVTVSCQNDLGDAIVGRSVVFDVVSGPNVGEGGATVTDAAGDASFTYLGDGGAGTDVITATVTGIANIQPASVEKQWVASQARCDVDGDADVDYDDVSAIFAARGSLASGPDDPRDADGNGIINVNDGRICALACNEEACKSISPPPACGLFGIEPFALVGWAAWRRRWRRGSR